MDISNSLWADQMTKKAIAYSPTAAAFLSLQPEASAQIIYTDVDPDVQITAFDTIAIDIDNNGVDNFRFWHFMRAETCIYYNSSYIPINNPFIDRTVEKAFTDGEDVYILLDSDGLITCGLLNVSGEGEFQNATFFDEGNEVVQNLEKWFSENDECISYAYRKKVYIGE